MSSDSNFSVDFLIKTAFEYELTNYLKRYTIEQRPAEYSAVVAYLEKRIKEIKERYT